MPDKRDNGTGGRKNKPLNGRTDSFAESQRQGFKGSKVKGKDTDHSTEKHAKNNEGQAPAGDGKDQGSTFEYLFEKMMQSGSKVGTQSAHGDTGDSNTRKKEAAEQRPRHGSTSTAEPPKKDEAGHSSSKEPEKDLSGRERGEQEQSRAGRRRETASKPLSTAQQVPKRTDRPQNTERVRDWNGHVPGNSDVESLVSERTAGAQPNGGSSRNVEPRLEQRKNVTDRLHDITSALKGGITNDKEKQKRQEQDLSLSQAGSLPKNATDKKSRKARVTFTDEERSLDSAVTPATSVSPQRKLNEKAESVRDAADQRRGRPLHRGGWDDQHTCTGSNDNNSSRASVHSTAFSQAGVSQFSSRSSPPHLVETKCAYPGCGDWIAFDTRTRKLVDLSLLPPEICLTCWQPWPANLPFTPDMVEAINRRLDHAFEMEGYNNIYCAKHAAEMAQKDDGTEGLEDTETKSLGRVDEGVQADSDDLDTILPRSNGSIDEGVQADEDEPLPTRADEGVQADPDELDANYPVSNGGEDEGIQTNEDEPLPANVDEGVQANPDDLDTSRLRSDDRTDEGVQIDEDETGPVNVDEGVQVDERDLQGSGSKRGTDHHCETFEFERDTEDRDPQTFSSDPKRVKGKKRALLIGINYYAQPHELRGCRNDVANMYQYLRANGYRDENIEILLDISPFKPPTKRNIIDHMKRLVEGNKAGDSLFLHYSGHGGHTIDRGHDEVDGQDECIYPVDYLRLGSDGMLIDDEMHDILTNVPKGVELTCLFDSCHSGSVLDLPYVLGDDGEMRKEKFRKPEKKDLKKLKNCGRIILWSGCKDSQTSADANIDGEPTGAMSHAFILANNQLRERAGKSSKGFFSMSSKAAGYTYEDLLVMIREDLGKRSQTPQLSSTEGLKPETQVVYV